MSKEGGAEARDGDVARAIARVMAGLREVEAPEGMERRALAAVTAAEAVGVRRWWSLCGVVKQPAVVTGAMAAVLVLVLGWTMRPGPRRAGQEVWRTEARTTSRAERSEVGDLRVGEVDGARPEAMARKRRVAARVGESARGRAATPERVGAEESVIESEMRAKSFPAPEAPLTEDERLLRRLARRGDPEELLATLNPARAAAQEQAEKAAFDRFFPPPPPLVETAKGGSE